MLKIKKLGKIFGVLLTAALALISASFGVYAEDYEEYEFSVATAKETNGAWGQSFVCDSGVFSAGRFTENTQIFVEFEMTGEKQAYTTSPVELILQNYSTADPQIWAKTAPVEYTDTTATFNYADFAESYGEELSGVDNIIIGDCGVPVIVTKMTATNVKPAIVITTAETEPETEAVTEAETAVSAEEAAPVTEVAADTNPDSSTFVI